MGRKRKDLAKIREQFPSIDNLDWERAFREDTTLYGRVWRDILKLDQAGEGRPGPRPALDQEKAFKRYLQLTDDDFTMLPFSEAVKALSHNMSVRKLAALTGLDRNLVQRLLAGKVEPDAYEIEIVAGALDCRPSYFLEYRIGYVLSLVHSHMMKFPESSVGPFLKARGGLEKQSS